MDNQAKAVQIVSIIGDAEREFKLNTKALEEILLGPEVADKKVAIFNIAGAYRTGKSSLLNSFLRYLSWRSDVEHNANDDWLDVDKPLKGFMSGGGSEDGMFIWSKPFIVKHDNGEEIALLLMNTQGAFDSQSTIKSCATLFALSTMVSSVQIYNLSQDIQEDDLQHLQLFTEYGQLAFKKSESKPFQSLLFLVRDWSASWRYNYGFKSGQRLLKKRLKPSNKQPADLQQVRQHIPECFENITCFLMPSPGDNLAADSSFNGPLKDIEPKFIKQLRVLASRLMDSKNIEAKRINGTEITCRQLLEYIESCFEVFNGESLPEPESILEIIAKINNLAIVADALAAYRREMKKICGANTPHLSEAELEKEHERCKNEAMQQFRNARKMGGVHFSLQFLDKLERDFKAHYVAYQIANKVKDSIELASTSEVPIHLNDRQMAGKQSKTENRSGIFRKIFQGPKKIVKNLATIVGKRVAQSNPAGTKDEP